MNPSIKELEKVISQLASNIEYLNEHVSNANALSHRVLPLQRKIKEVNLQIRKQRRQSPQNKPYISQLSEQEYQLQLSLQAIENIELQLSRTLDLMVSFCQKHSVRKDLIDKYSEEELHILSTLHQLSKPNSLNKGRAILNEYLAEVPPSNLIELLNTKFRLSGYKRFYYEGGKISSKYINDLKFTLLTAFDKKNFSDLIRIIKKHYPTGHQLKPIEILKTVLNHFNKRQVK